MNFKELVEAVYEECRNSNDGLPSVTREQVKRILSVAFKCMRNTLTKKQNVKIKNFGTFIIRRRRGREINNNFVTGHVVQAHNTVHFEPAEQFKEEIW